MTRLHVPPARDEERGRGATCMLPTRRRTVASQDATAEPRSPGPAARVEERNDGSRVAPVARREQSTRRCGVRGRSARGRATCIVYSSSFLITAYASGCVSVSFSKCHAQMWYPHRTRVTILTVLRTKAYTDASTRRGEQVTSPHWLMKHAAAGRHSRYLTRRTPDTHDSHGTTVHAGSLTRWGAHELHSKSHNNVGSG